MACSLHCQQAILTRPWVKFHSRSGFKKEVEWAPRLTQPKMGVTKSIMRKWRQLAGYWACHSLSAHWQFIHAVVSHCYQNWLTMVILLQKVSICLQIKLLVGQNYEATFTALSPQRRLHFSHKGTQLRGAVCIAYVTNPHEKFWIVKSGTNAQTSFKFSKVACKRIFKARAILAYTFASLPVLVLMYWAEILLVWCMGGEALMGIKGARVKGWGMN